MCIGWIECENREVVSISAWVDIIFIVVYKRHLAIYWQNNIDIPQYWRVSVGVDGVRMIKVAYFRDM